MTDTDRPIEKEWLKDHLDFWKEERKKGNYGGNPDGLTDAYFWSAVVLTHMGEWARAQDHFYQAQTFRRNIVSDKALLGKLYVRMAKNLARLPHKPDKGGQKLLAEILTTARQHRIKS